MPISSQALLRQITLELQRRRLEEYRPYTKQASFHELGSSKRERLLRAGNQLGKTYAGAAEAAYHATGLYPAWWRGRRFTKATLGWCGGITGEVTRDTIQRLLIGPVGQRGTGLVPQKLIVEVIPARGVADLADTIIVRHVSGSNSRIRLKYYEQGREKWQSDTVDWVWFDEEPDLSIYTEGLTRTNATGGLVWMTFTPLLGMSDVVMRFLSGEHPDRADINMTIDDAEHIPPEEKRKIIASYPPHEKEARINGTPMLGSGRVFPIPEEALYEDRIEIKPHWPRIVGIDFGIDHPFAAVWIAWDRDTDTIHIYDCYRVKDGTVNTHTPAVRSKGPWIPVAWPHDGLVRDKGSGVELAKQYRDAGLNMLPEKATFEGGGNGVEAGIMDMLARMETVRFKVARHLTDWFEEFRLYHREKGLLVKERDDLMSATRYALMMLRFAEVQKKSLPLKYQKLGTV